MRDNVLALFDSRATRPGSAAAGRQRTPVASRRTAASASAVRRSPPELVEADRRLDVVAQDRLADVNIAGKHGVDALAQQRLGVGRIFGQMPLQNALKPRVSSISVGSSLSRAALPDRA